MCIVLDISCLRSEYQQNLQQLELVVVFGLFSADSLHCTAISYLHEVTA
jgi:hypothetical protein